MWLRSLIGVVACAAAFGALAEEQPEPAFVVVHQLEENVFGDDATAVDEEHLSKLRGRLAAPMQVHQVGVILWDEPRHGAPPMPGAPEPQNAPNISASGTIHR